MKFNYSPFLPNHRHINGISLQRKTSSTRRRFTHLLTGMLEHTPGSVQQDWCLCSPATGRSGWTWRARGCRLWIPPHSGLPWPMRRAGGTGWCTWRCTRWPKGRGEQLIKMCVHVYWALDKVWLKVWFCSKITNNKYFTCCRWCFEKPYFGETDFNSDLS